MAAVDHVRAAHHPRLHLELGAGGEVFTGDDVQVQALRRVLAAAETQAVVQVYAFSGRRSLGVPTDRIGLGGQVKGCLHTPLR